MQRQQLKAIEELYNSAVASGRMAFAREIERQWLAALIELRDEERRSSNRRPAEVEAAF